MNASRTPEPGDLLRALVARAGEGRPFALAVVLKADGSTPCKAGAKAIVDAEGAIHGTIGGGRVEAETQRRAAEILGAGRALVLDFDLESGTVDRGDPICGGAMRILIDPGAAGHRAAYELAAATRDRRGRGVLLTTVAGAEPRDVTVEFLPEETIPDDLGFPGAESVRAALRREAAALFVSERAEVLVEPLSPKPVLVIVGGGHVGQALAAQAGLVGFDLVVIDDRPEFTRPELFPDGTATRCGPIGEEVARFPFDADTYVVIATRGHRHDAEALAACLGRPAAYVGMIGSRRKVAMMRKEFVDAGRSTRVEIDRVYAPIGLDIGSVTVPEIAASVVAQLIAVRRCGTAPRILDRQGHS